MISKLLKGLAVVAMAVIMVACGGVQSKAESYAEKIAKATAAGDYEALNKLETEIEEYVDGLSDEDADNFEEALEAQVTILIKAAEEKATEDAIKAMGEAAEAMNEAAEALTNELSQEAIKEAEKYLENVSEETLKEAEAAVEKALNDLLDE